MSDARDELVVKVKELLATWERGEMPNTSHFSGSFVSSSANSAYATDTLYRATMNLAEELADALYHGFPNVNLMDLASAARVLEMAVGRLAAGSDEVPTEISAFPYL